MKVIKFTSTQAAKLAGEYNGSVLQPVLDGNGNLIVGTEVLQDENFAEIRDQLSALPLIDYVKPALKT